VVVLRAELPEEDLALLDGPENAAGRVGWFRSQDGLSLAVRFFDSGDRTRLPLLCLPGLSRNSRDFTKLGRYFAHHPLEPRRVVAVDYRGRGLSDWDGDWRNYRPLTEAQDLLSAAAAFGIERAILVGTSRGGILAMLLGAIRPALIAGIVLNDIGPVIEGRGLARIKGYLSVKRRTIETWDEVLKEVRAASEAQYPGLDEHGLRALAAAYYGETDDGFEALFDPDLSKAIVDVDISGKVPALWPQFMSLGAVPVLAIRGALSDILSERTLHEMKDRHPRLETLTVERQGHPPLLRDEATLDRIRAFARRCEEQTHPQTKKAAQEAREA
jgi:pimeloyl-ACP methyl ester carboxylesterase